MSDKQINLLQGTLDLLILKVLALEEMHGLGISHRIKQVTKGTFDVKPGSLFPARRLERVGWLVPLGVKRKTGSGAVETHLVGDEERIGSDLTGGPESHAFVIKIRRLLAQPVSQDTDRAGVARSETA